MSVMGGLPAHAEDSLPALPSHVQNDAQLAAHLASRFHARLPIARLNSHAILSFNTYESSSRGPHGGEEGSAMGAAKDLAARAWARLGHREENQAVVFLYVQSLSLFISSSNGSAGANPALEKPHFAHTYYPRSSHILPRPCLKSCPMLHLSSTR